MSKMDLNFVNRYTKLSYDGSTSATKVRASNQKLIYSKYRPCKMFKHHNHNDFFISCAYTSDDQCLLAGSWEGKVYIFNKYNNALIAQKKVHPNLVTSLVPDISGNLLLTSGHNSNGGDESALWNVKNNFENQFMFNDCHHAVFTHAQEKVLATSRASAKLYDLNSGHVIHEYKPKTKTSKSDISNKAAALNPFDELLLFDGVMFDVRSGKEIHRFDEINPDLNCAFHANRLEIINSSKIWDLKTFHLLQTVESLELCYPIFNNYGDVIFGLCYGIQDVTYFEVLDATNYSSIAKIDVHKVVTSLAINTKDTQIAVAEADVPTEDDFGTEVVRLYDIGMMRHEEELQGDEKVIMI